jgi:hypothetical protein
MPIRNLQTVSIGFALACASVSIAWAEVPAGWSISGSAPSEYEFSRTATGRSGKFAALIEAKPGAGGGFGTLMQGISAENYRGARWKLSGYLKTEQAKRAQMWMRVDGPDKAPLAFDNMDSRAVSGTTEWTRYEIVLDVPQNSMAIAFGFFLSSGGKVWGDDFMIEKVDATVPVTSTVPGSPSMPKAPANPDFER